MGKPKIKKTIDTTLVDSSGKYTELGLKWIKELRATNKVWITEIIKLGSAAEVGYMIDSLKHDALFARLLQRTA